MNNKDRLVTIGKIIVFVALCYIILSRLKSDAGLLDTWHLFIQQQSDANAVWLIFVIMLLPANWLLETFKWQLLLSAQQTTFKTLLKAVLSGVTIGFITPGRAGEFIGRTIHMQAAGRVSAFYISVLGGIGQSAVTMMAGSLAMSWLGLPVLWSAMAAGVAVVFYSMYFRFDWFQTILKRFTVLGDRSLTLEDNEMPSAVLLWKALGISVLRYGVYVAQYALLCKYFRLEGTQFVLIAKTVMYLAIQTFSPFMPWADMPYRGGVALLVFDTAGSNPIAVLSVATMGWFINLCIPAIVGYVFILKFKYGSYDAK